MYNFILNKNSSRDECSIETACPKDHQCKNTDGSYWCECFEGYEFKAEYNNCIDIGGVSKFEFSNEGNIKFPIFNMHPYFGAFQTINILFGAFNIAPYMWWSPFVKMSVSSICTTADRHKSV